MSQTDCKVEPLKMDPSISLRQTSHPDPVKVSKKGISKRVIESKKRLPSTIWSDEETKSFYFALYQFGTDFSTMEGVIPNRIRRQLYLKFKIEERKNPIIIDSLMSRKSSFETILKIID
jgi:hypothetical protein